MTPRREFTVVAGICGVGAGLVLLASGQSWVHVTVDLPRPLPDGRHLLTGGELAPLIAALGLAGLAGLAGLVATRSYARIVVGAIVAIFGGAVIYASLIAKSGVAVREVLTDEAVLSEGALGTTFTAWWAVAVAGGVLLAIAGAMTVLRGGRWPGLSRRYDAPRSADVTAASTGPEPRDKGADRRPGSVPNSVGDRPRGGADAGGDMWDSLDHGHDPTTSYWAGR